MFSTLLGMIMEVFYKLNSDLSGRISQKGISIFLNKQKTYNYPKVI